jgi:inhibitor of KinA sporulation pathway (predicted exonuclease)
MKLDIINKLIHLILSFSLLGSVLAKAKKAKSSGLNQEDIFNRITAHPLDNGVLNLNEKDFKDFIRTPRNFSLAVALTALGAEFGCTQCV